MSKGNDLNFPVDGTDVGGWLEELNSMNSEASFVKGNKERIIFDTKGTLKKLPNGGFNWLSFYHTSESFGNDERKVTIPYETAIYCETYALAKDFCYNAIRHVLSNFSTWSEVGVSMVVPEITDFPSEEDWSPVYVIDGESEPIDSYSSLVNYAETYSTTELTIVNWKDYSDYKEPLNFQYKDYLVNVNSANQIAFYCETKEMEENFLAFCRSKKINMSIDNSLNLVTDDSYFFVGQKMSFKDLADSSCIIPWVLHPLAKSFDDSPKVGSLNDSQEVMKKPFDWSSLKDGNSVVVCKTVKEARNFFEALLKQDGMVEHLLKLVESKGFSETRDILSEFESHYLRLEHWNYGSDCYDYSDLVFSMQMGADLPVKTDEVSLKELFLEAKGKPIDKICYWSDYYNEAEEDMFYFGEVIHEWEDLDDTTVYCKTDELKRDFVEKLNRYLLRHLFWISNEEYNLFPNLSNYNEYFINDYFVYNTRKCLDTPDSQKSISGITDFNNAKGNIEIVNFALNLSKTPFKVYDWSIYKDRCYEETYLPFSVTYFSGYCKAFYCPTLELAESFCEEYTRLVIKNPKKRERVKSYLLSSWYKYKEETCFLGSAETLPKSLIDGVLGKVMDFTILYWDPKIVSDFSPISKEFSKVSELYYNLPSVPDEFLNGYSFVKKSPIKEFNWVDFLNQHYVIHCSTQEDLVSFQKYWLSRLDKSTIMHTFVEGNKYFRISNDKYYSEIWKGDEVLTISNDCCFLAIWEDDNSIGTAYTDLDVVKRNTTVVEWEDIMGKEIPEVPDMPTLNLPELTSSGKLYAVLCKSPELAKELLQLFSENGLKWADGKSYEPEVDMSLWGKRKEVTCYTLDGRISSLSDLEKRGYIILDWFNYSLLPTIGGLCLGFREGEEETVLVDPLIWGLKYWSCDETLLDNLVDLSNLTEEQRENVKSLVKELEESNKK